MSYLIAIFLFLIVAVFVAATWWISPIAAIGGLFGAYLVISDKN